MGRFPSAQDWHFDIDHYLNRIIPPSPLHKLPTPVSRYLGYRKEQEQDVGNILGAWWSFVGAFCGLAVVAGIFNNTASIQMHHPPALIASFGASAVLEYNAIRSPLGQPRNALLGHTFSAIVGVAITKLFMYHDDFQRIRWLAGAVSCGTASAVMLMTGTVHPPGGASAVLAATSPEITAMGWYFVGLVMWGTTLMLIVGLVINNIQRQFPVYWWTPMDLRRARKGDVETRGDGRGGVEKRRTQEEQMDENERRRGESISVTAYEVDVPDDISLNIDEIRVLEKLRDRLKELREKKSENEGGLEKVPSSGQSSMDMTVVPSQGGRSDESTSGIYS